MTRQRSLLGLWLIILLLASACEPARLSSGSLPVSSAALSTSPAPLPAATRLPVRANSTASSLSPDPTPVPTLLTPRPAVASRPVEIKKFSNVAYAQLPGIDPNLLSLDIYSASQTGSLQPVMIYVHGGGWLAGDKRDVDHKPEFFVKAGFVFVSVNYRLSPKAKFPAHASDVALSVAWVYQNIAGYGGDPKKLNLMGHSAGAHLAVLVSTDEQYLKAYGLDLSNIRSVVSLDTAGYDLAVFARRCKGNTLPDPYGTAFGQVPDEWQAASPVTYVKAGKHIPPMVVVYSGDVGIGSSVTRELMAEEFSQTLNEAGVMYILEGAPDKNHGQINVDFGRPGDTLSERVLASLKKLVPTEFN